MKIMLSSSSNNSGGCNYNEIDDEFPEKVMQESLFTLNL